MRSFSVPIHECGALVRVLVGVSEPRRKALLREKQTVPPPVEADFLIDTGASCSWVDEGIMRSLGLRPRSWDEVHNMSGRGVPEKFPLYEVGLVIGGLATPNSRRFDLPVGGDSLLNQSFVGILGRDVLNICRLGWQGPARTLQIDYE